MVTAGDSHTGARATARSRSWGTCAPRNSSARNSAARRRAAQFFECHRRLRYRDSNGYLGYSADEKKAAEPRLVALQGGALIKQIASGADHTLAVGANGVDVYSWGCGEKGQIGCGISWEAGEPGTLGRSADAKPHTLPQPWSRSPRPGPQATSSEAVTPNAPFGLAVPEWRGAGGAKARVGRALNENFWRAIGQKVAAEAGADLRGACAESSTAPTSEPRAPRSTTSCASACAPPSPARTTRSSSPRPATSTPSASTTTASSASIAGEPPFSAEPHLVDALQGERVVQIVAGEHHSLALAADGAVFAFGRGDNSQLGLPGVEQQVTPAKVPALDGVRSPSSRAARTSAWR